MTMPSHSPAVRRVPTLSLRGYTHGTTAEREAFRAGLFAGLTDYGFIILGDHGVPGELLDRAYALAGEFFALPEAEKRAACGGLRGYTPFGTEHARDHAVPDLKEFFQVGRDAAHCPRNTWPARPPAFRETFTQLFAALDTAGRVLLEALAPALQLPPTWFEERVAAGNSVLRVIHYPPVAADAPPGAVRSAAHEDINLLTLLVAARGSGLQLKDRDGSWLPVETVPQNLIVDSGDMLQRLTNGLIPSTTHRVVNPDDGPNTSRYSMPFFLHPTDETSLGALPNCVPEGAAPRYAPITAGEYLAERLREIGLKDA